MRLKGPAMWTLSSSRIFSPLPNCHFTEMLPLYRHGSKLVEKVEPPKVDATNVKPWGPPHTGLLV